MVRLTIEASTAVSQTDQNAVVRLAWKRACANLAASAYFAECVSRLGGSIRIT